MWVGSNPRRLSGWSIRGWAVFALAAVLMAGCSSGKDDRAEAADEDRRAASSGKSGDVLAAFDAWAKDTDTAGEDGAGNSAGQEVPQGAGHLDGGITQFNRKVSTCWKQPFGMPRLATVRLLVMFNPDGTVRDVAPRPAPNEALRYRTEASYLVMIAQTSQALRNCQPYDGIRQNYTELSQLEMVVDPRMFRN